MVAAPEKTTEMKEVVAVEESTENSKPKDVAMIKEDNESKSKTAVEKMNLGKKAMLLNEPQEAVEHFAEACASMSKVYGDMAKEMCDYHFNYGTALLEVARLEENVLGNALSGVPEDSGLDDSQVEDPDKLTVEEKEEVADEVDKALAENFKGGNKKVETEAKKSDEKKETEKTDEKKEAEKTDEKKEAEKTDEKKEAEKTNEKKEAEKTNEKKEAEKTDEKKEAEKSDEKKEAEKTDEMKEAEKTDEKEEATKSDDKKEKESEMETDAVVADKKEDAADKPEAEEKEDSEEETAEEDDAMEEDAASDAAIADDDDSQESTQEEDVSTLQLAYEVLEISKTIYERINERTEEENLKLSQVYLKLGEVASENEQYEESVTQYTLCLKLQETLLPADDRLLAETNYQLGLAHSFADDYDPALKHIESAVAIIKTRISNKTDVLAKKDVTIKEDMDVSKLDEDIKKIVNEVREMQKVLPELEDKIADIKETKASCMEKLKAMKNTLMSAFGEAADAAGSSAFGASGFEAKETTNGSAAPAAKPIATNMIRKKRKPEEEVNTEEPSKKPRTESSNGADKEEAKTDEVKPTEK